MANMSNAFGNITFESTSLDYLAIFVHYFQKVKLEEYYTISLDLIDENNFSRDQILDKKQYGNDFEYDRNRIEKHSEKTVSNNSTIYSFSDFFNGFGKYCFRNNFDFFFNLEKYEAEINELTGSKYEDVIKSMTIRLKYTDEEPASEMLEEVSAVLVPNMEAIKEKRIGSCEVIECKVTSHDYTIENLQFYDCYDEACSLNYLLKNADYFFDGNETNARRLLTKALDENPKEADEIFTGVEELLNHFNITELA